MLKLYYKINFATEPKGRPLLYSPNAKNPHKRIVYHRVIELLDKGESISKIAKDVGITRQTIYRIKKGRPNYKFIE
ncbi:hypothetical protein HpBTM60_27450 [Helicobacter pylori]